LRLPFRCCRLAAGAPLRVRDDHRTGAVRALVPGPVCRARFVTGSLRYCYIAKLEVM